MPKDETGIAAFTLAEVLISVVLMLLSLSLLLSAFVSSKRSVALSQARLSALQIACDEAERLRTNAYASIGPTNTTLTNTLIGCQMSRSVTNCSITTNILDTYRDITITIQWIDPASKRSQALTNYVTICKTNWS
jgi:Tfp pilus assembly protein PilV